jgi:hypothetical protein
MVADGTLNFVLPDFTRVSWVSERARAAWEPRLRRISQAWNEIGWQTVAKRIRPAFVTSTSLDDLVSKSALWCEHGLATLPLALEGTPGDSYAASAPPLRHGEPIRVPIAVGLPHDLAAVRRAWESRDDAAIGALLGYPGCCSTFFREIWIDAGCIDTTWQMALNTAGPADPDGAVTVDGPMAANILWRWVGVRAVPHLPCRFDCEASAALGEQFLNVGRESGFTDEMEWMQEILDWPVEWSALHGIAEIKTPILKISARTDATARKRSFTGTGAHLRPKAPVGSRSHS